MRMDGITADQMLNTFGVLLIIFGAIVTVDKVVDIFKKWKKPSVDIMQKLDNDKTRLDAHEKDINELRKDNQVILGGVLALLDHQLHNGNSEQMEKARDAIMQRLQEK